jgi:DNA-binding transcriptional regulator YiaG
MVSHPNRSRRRQSAAANPSPEEIKSARLAAGLTQTQAARLVHGTCRMWQYWEAGERRMHPAIWQLFLLRTTHPAIRELLGLP